MQPKFLLSGAYPLKHSLKEYIDKDLQMKIHHIFYRLFFTSEMKKKGKNVHP